MESRNQVAVELVDEAIDFADDLNIGVTQLENDATVIDCGVEQPGGLEAGVLFAEIQAGGLIVTRTRGDTLDGVPWTFVELECDHPGQLTSLTGSQQILNVDGFSGVMSGPVQLVLGDAAPSVEEEFDFTVVSCYSAELPSAATARAIAEETGKPASGVFFVVNSLTSLSGRVATAATAPSGVISMLGGDDQWSGELEAVTARAPIPPSRSSHAGLESGIDAVELGGSVQVFLSGDIQPIKSIESRGYENWLRDPGVGDTLGVKNQQISDGRIPHTSIVGRDDCVIFGEQNEAELRKKWLTTTG